MKYNQHYIENTVIHTIIPPFRIGINQILVKRGDYHVKIELFKMNFERGGLWQEGGLWLELRNNKF